MFDLLAVKITAPHQVRFIGQGLSKRDAEAMGIMAVLRRGVGEELYVIGAAGSYQEGECWTGDKASAK